MQREDVSRDVSPVHQSFYPAQMYTPRRIKQHQHPLPMHETTYGVMSAIRGPCLSAAMGV